MLPIKLRVDGLRTCAALIDNGAKIAVCCSDGVLTVENFGDGEHRLFSQPSPLNPAAAGSGYRRTINCGHAPLAWPPPPHSSVSMFVAMMLPSG